MAGGGRRSRWDDGASARMAGVQASVPAGVASRPAGRRRRRRVPRWVDRLVTALLILAGVALLVWPWIVDRIASDGAGQTISEVTAQVDALPAAQKQQYLDQAHAYNDVLAGLDAPIDPASIMPYESQLSFDRDPMMSWVEIPSINVSMPIYHGTSDAVLMAGVGHLEGSSLPVGGASTHCVLTAHSGMRNLRMFDDIRQLVPGDVVLIHTMGDVYAYRVTSSEVVLPEEMSSLAIQPGQDLLTLVTCTPYGVNDHRLLVHCERTDYTPEEAQQAAEIQNRHWGAREIAVVVVAVTMAGLAVDAVAHAVRGRRRKDAYVPRH